MGSETITVKTGPLPGLAELLEKHPHVQLDRAPTEATLEISQHGWIRRIWIDRDSVPLFGLVELMDNNPLVCADEFSLPSPEGALSLIGLGPLIRCGALMGTPRAEFTFNVRPDSCLHALQSAHWANGIETAGGGGAHGTVLQALFRVDVDPGAADDVPGIYEEVFGPSFYVRTMAPDCWNPADVDGQPFAELTFEGGRPGVVRVAADRNGKCGAAQVVHAMNIMCGFEECLGIPERVRAK